MMSDFINLISWQVSCSLHGEYSASLGVIDVGDEYNEIEEWHPIACTLSTAVTSTTATGVSASEGGTRQHIYGLIESLSIQEGIIEKVKSFKIGSFFNRLQKKPVIESADRDADIRATLMRLAEKECGIPIDLYDFSKIPTSLTYKGLVKGENILTEMRKLAQAAQCYLFVNEEGKLIIEPWKDQNSSIDYTIPSSFIIDVSKELVPKAPAAIYTIRGANIYSLDTPNQITNSGSGMHNTGVSQGSVTRTRIEGKRSASKDPGEGNTKSISGGAIKMGDRNKPVGDKSIKKSLGINISGQLSPGSYDQVVANRDGYGLPLTDAKKEKWTPSEAATDAENNSLTLTAVSGQGIFGRFINIKGNAQDSAGIDINVVGQTIEVGFKKGSTLTEIKNAINGNAAAAKQVTVTGAGTATISKSFSIFLDDFSRPDPGTPTTYKMETVTLGNKQFDSPFEKPNRLQENKTKTDLDIQALKDHADSRNTRRAGFPGGGQREGGEDANYSTTESDPARLEAICGDCTKLTVEGIQREELENEYLATTTQCDLVCQRSVAESVLDRNAYKINMVYNPHVRLNKVVQFTMPQTGATIRGPVVELSINYTASPSATMSITVQNVLALSDTLAKSSNLLSLPDIPYIGGTIWNTLYSSAFNARYTASTIAFTAGSPCTITDSGNGFVDAGFQVGQWVNVRGAGARHNNANFQIAAVAAGTLTLRTHDTVVGESAGNSITLTHHLIEPKEWRYVRALSNTLVFDIPDSGVERYCHQTIPTISGKNYKIIFSGNRVSGATGIKVYNNSSSVTLAPSSDQAFEDFSTDFTASDTFTTIKWEATGPCRWEICRMKVIRQD